MKKEVIYLRNELEKTPVPIVSDGAVAIKGLGDGRIIPILIINTSKRPDIEDMANSHKHLSPGDATSTWCSISRFNKNRLNLFLEFTKPSQCSFFLEFDVMAQGGVIDQIIQAESTYIQPGRDGDRLSSSFNSTRILVEIPSKHFRKKWDQIFSKAIYKKFKKNGLPRNKAKLATKIFIEDWRSTGSIRIGNN